MPQSELILKKIINHMPFESSDGIFIFHATGLYALEKAKNYGRSPLQVRLRIAKKDEIERTDFPKVTVVLDEAEKLKKE